MRAKGGRDRNNSQGLVEAVAGVGSKSKWKLHGSAKPYLCLFLSDVTSPSAVHLTSPLQAVLMKSPALQLLRRNLNIVQKNRTFICKQIEWRKGFWLFEKEKWADVEKYCAFSLLQRFDMCWWLQEGKAVYTLYRYWQCFFPQVFCNVMIWQFRAEYYESIQRPRNIQCPTSHLKKWH